MKSAATPPETAVTLDVLANDTDIDGGPLAIASKTDGNGHVTTTTYDALDRPVAIVNPLQQATQYQYDLLGNLVALTDAANRAEQVENLFLFFQALRRVTEEGDDLLDAFLHAVKFTEGLVSLDNFIGKDAAEAWVLRGVNDLRFANRHQHALGGTGINARVRFTKFEVLLDR